MGSWALFYEDDQSWSKSLGEVCSAIVSYGVELPWCVCATSSSIIQQAWDQVLALIALLGIDQWWQHEHSILAFFLLFNVPLALRHSKGNRCAFASRQLVGLASMALLGCMIELVSGLQGGVVFGGKLFHPTAAVCALACQCMANFVQLIFREVFGFAGGRPAEESRASRVLATSERLLNIEAVFIYALAAFGLPKVEQEPELAPWLCALPVMAAVKVLSEFNPDGDDSKAEEPEKKKAEEAPANGEVVKEKEPEKKKEADKKEEKKEEKKDAEKKEEEPAAPAADEKPKASPLAAAKRCLCACACLCQRACAPVCGLVCAAYARAAALPWACMADAVSHFGTLALFAFVLCSLTDDAAAAAAVPGLACVAPMLVRRFAADKLGADKTQLLLDALRLAAAAVQYSVFKANIVQAY